MTRIGRFTVSLRTAAASAAMALALILGPAPHAQSVAWAQSQTDLPEARAPGAGTVPGGTLGSASDSEIWRAVRQGAQGTVSIPNKKAGVLIQSEGEIWRSWRNGPVTLYGAWFLLGVVALLAIFFLIRGRVRVAAGESGRTIERFTAVERGAHWLTAVSFVVLALTGLNMLFGRHAFLPVVGPEIFATLTYWGKYAHDFLSFAFMIGLVVLFVFWVGRNLPNRHDLAWLAKGGGIVGKAHVPAKKFNAGQKIIFWLTILGGVSLSLSGIALLFPFQFAFFSGTFAFLNIFGLDLPTNLQAVQEMQLSQLWHVVVGLFMMGVILAHIYIGTIGMEGAFAAMGSGRVDENWAREHHNLWYAELTESKGQPRPAPQPAE